MMYAALVINKNTKEEAIIKREYKNKEDFIDDLLGNGYIVDNDKIKESKLFDYIMAQNEKDWSIEEIPKISEKEASIKRFAKLKEISQMVNAFIVEYGETQLPEEVAASLENLDDACMKARRAEIKHRLQIAG